MTDNLAVFVSDIPQSREAKLAYGLQQAGWQVVLLYRDYPIFDANKYCVEAQRYGTCEEALALACRYTPVVYHVFSTWGFDVAGAFIRHKPGKIVFDNYDMIAGMVKEDFAKAQAEGVAMERFCLENADGLCCRSLETQYAKRYMGYKYRKRIFFPEYCWNLPNPPAKQPVVDGRLNMASIGNLNVNQYCAVDSPSNYHLELAIRLSRHNIKSFLYLSACWGPELELFLKKTLEGNLDVYFGNVPYEQLLYELQTLCHVGVLCLPRVDAPGLEAEPYRQTKREYAAGNKVFDYIDAAIPIVMESEIKFLRWFIKRYHEVFDFDAFMADLYGYRNRIQDLLANHVEELSQARKTLSVCHQIQRLIKFYESI